MHDAFVVSGRQAICDLHGVFDDFSLRNGPAIEHGAKAFSLQQLGNQKRRAVVVAYVVDRENVRMIEGRDGLRFLLEAAQAVASRAKDSGRIFSATSRPRRVSRAR